MPPTTQVTVRLFPSRGTLTVKQLGTTWPELRLESQAMITRAGDFRPVWDAFHPLWQESIRDDVFAAEGPGWPALSPAYAARKKGPAMLVESGRLLNSLASNTGDSVYEVTGQSVRKGSNVPYFPYHQSGTRKMPARPPLVLVPDLLERLGAGMAGYVARGIVRF